VIVVVIEDTSISCFDSKLNLLWESAVFVKKQKVGAILNKFYADDVAVVVLPLSLEENSAGVVIVGTSLSLCADENHFEIEEGFDMNENGEREHPEMYAKARLGHFNVKAAFSHATAAFSGATTGSTCEVSSTPNLCHNMPSSWTGATWPLRYTARPAWATGLSSRTASSRSCRTTGTLEKTPCCASLTLRGVILVRVL
jgi:hypothetical protein